MANEAKKGDGTAESVATNRPKLEAASSQGKLAYSAPKLKSLGKVAELTFAKSVATGEGPLKKHTG
jgi:hypothetical protein